MPFFTGSSDVRINNSYLSEVAGDFIINLTATAGWFQSSFESPDVNETEFSGCFTNDTWKEKGLRR